MPEVIVHICQIWRVYIPPLSQHKHDTLFVSKYENLFISKYTFLFFSKVQVLLLFYFQYS